MMHEDPFVDVLTAAVEVLDRVGITYAITGSIASGIFGEPIPSQDVDLVVRMTAAQARTLAQELPRRFYRSAERLVYIAEHGGLANLIDADAGLKVDLSVPAGTPFHEAVFSRRAMAPFGPDGPSFYFVTPEDVILMKLVWRKDSRSHKQWENALSVVRVKGASLDWKYMFEQSRQLGIEDDLIKLRDEGGV